MAELLGRPEPRALLRFNLGLEAVSQSVRRNGEKAMEFPRRIFIALGGDEITSIMNSEQKLKDAEENLKEMKRNYEEAKKLEVKVTALKEQIQIIAGAAGSFILVLVLVLAIWFWPASQPPAPPAPPQQPPKLPARSAAPSRECLRECGPPDYWDYRSWWFRAPPRHQDFECWRDRSIRGRCF